MKKKAFLYLAIFSTTLFACSKSKTEPEPESASISSVSQGLPVKSITRSATGRSGYFNWVFNYLPKKVISGTGQYFWSDQIRSEPISNITYTNNEGTIAGSFWISTFTGTLNAMGYLATLTETISSSQIWNYSFTYTSDGYLKSMVITFEDGTQRSTTFNYDEGNLVSEVETTGANTYTDTFQYGSIVNKAGIITTLNGDINYLSFFHYAALLGKPSKHLVSSASTQVGSSVVSQTNTYTLNDGYVNTCSVNISSTGSIDTYSYLVTYAYN